MLDCLVDYGLPAHWNAGALKFLNELVDLVNTVKSLSNQDISSAADLFAEFDLSGRIELDPRKWYYV